MILAGLALALVAVLHFRSSGPRYTDAHDARLVHYAVGGRHDLAVVPRRHGRQLAQYVRF